MAGSPLSAYLDLQARSGARVFSGPKEIVNDIQEVRNFAYNYFLRGKGEKDLLGAGKTITDEIAMIDPETAETHLPGKNFTWTNPQTSRYWTSRWRYVTGHYSFLDQEIEHNASGDLKASARYQKIKDMHYGKRQAAMSSLWIKMDKLMFAEPDFAAMEGAETSSSTEPYSLAAFVNEQSNGLFNTGAVASGMTPWTTVEELSPTATGNSHWVNAKRSYTSSSTTAAAGVIDGLEDAMMDIDYEPPPTERQYFEMPEVNRLVIATSRVGLKHYKNCIRDRQDILPDGGHKDAGISNPTFNNIPVVRWSGLETATWYPNDKTVASATDNVTEGQTGANGNTGPRYYMLHPKYIGPYFHVNRYFVEKWELKPTDQYEATTIPISVWFNWRCSSRQRHAIVYPSGNVFTTAY